MKRILVLDNYDSFTYNLVHLMKSFGSCTVEVVRNDKLALADVERFDGVVLSPGPGIPSEAGVMPELVRSFAGKRPILGVCLGHQCIGEIFGGTLVNMTDVCHGKGVETVVVDRSDPFFAGVPDRFVSGRYHSWMVSRERFPESLVVTALDDDGRVMALRHRELDVRGVQFHPESVLTPDGARMLRNWVEGR